MKNISKATLFLILTFAFSFSLAGGYYLLFGTGNMIGKTLLGVVYMFVPLLSVLIVEKVIHKEKIQKRLFISFRFNRWFVVAWLITPVIGFLTFGISLLLPGISFSPDMSGMIEKLSESMSPEQMADMKQSMENMPVHPFWLSLMSGLVAGATVNALAGFGEELGWRGFLLRAFEKMAFMKASILIGLIWGIWHAPLILMGHNYPGHPQIGVLMMITWCILLSPLFVYITLKSGSVIAAAIMHGTLNGTAGTAVMLIKGGNDLTTGMTGLPGFIALLLALIALFVYDRYIGKYQLMTHLIGYSLNSSAK